MLGSADNTIQLWDASTGIEMLRWHDNWIHSLAFSPDGSRIISRSQDSILRVWDASTGTVLRHPQADDTHRLAMGERMIRRWLINIDTGRYMGALPVGANFHSGHIHGSTYVGWTAGFQLVLVHFPEQ
jgi:WD40 repeat protein